eukprot:GDKJ01014779.1.p1 GENE.GDKJ01014779.1~~GDKJ01014779.1.p1  ORF type:complete len:220 (-),score=28.64 GDKJ01014779.1:533-1192(-)
MLRWFCDTPDDISASVVCNKCNRQCSKGEMSDHLLAHQLTESDTATSLSRESSSSTEVDLLDFFPWIHQNQEVDANQHSHLRVPPLSIMGQLLSELTLDHEEETSDNEDNNISDQAALIAFLRNMSPPQGQTVRSAPLTQGEIDVLPKSHLTRAQIDLMGIENVSCPICFDDFNENDEVRRLFCFHPFHTACIDEWLSKTSCLCPICKISARDGTPEED